MKHIFAKSNHVAGFQYDADKKTVTVNFNTGRSYTHVGVPQEAIDNWVKYRSPGEFYHQVLKRYPLVEKK